MARKSIKDMTKPEFKAYMLRKLNKLLNEVQIDINTMEWIAENRPDIEPPLDIEPFRLHRAWCLKNIKKFEAIDG
jgi:hypothetical protein